MSPRIVYQAVAVVFVIVATVIAVYLVNGRNGWWAIVAECVVLSFYYAWWSNYKKEDY